DLARGRRRDRRHQPQGRRHHLEPGRPGPGPPLHRDRRQGPRLAPQLTVPSIRAVVLDMDGLLIDTEPVWRTAAREILAQLGIDLTDADLLEGTGVRVDEMTAAFLAKRPGPAPSPATVA